MLKKDLIESLLEDEKLLKNINHSTQLHLNKGVETGFVVFNTAFYGTIYSRVICGDDSHINLPSTSVFQVESYEYDKLRTAYNAIHFPENFQFSTFGNAYRVNEILDLHLHPRTSILFDYIIPSGGEVDSFFNANGDIISHFISRQTDPPISMVAMVYQCNPLVVEILAYQKKEVDLSEAHKTLNPQELQNKLYELAKSLEKEKVPHSIGNREISNEINRSKILSSTILTYEESKNKITYNSQEIQNFSLKALQKLPEIKYETNLQP
jgi:hypothetical protein